MYTLFHLLVMATHMQMRDNAKQLYLHKKSEAKQREETPSVGQNMNNMGLSKSLAMLSEYSFVDMAAHCVDMR